MSISPKAVQLNNGMRPEAPGSSKQDKLEKKKLLNACKEFEGIFLSMLFKSMKKTVPDSGFMCENTGAEIYDDYFLEEIAREVSKVSSTGLASKMFAQLTGTLPSGDIVSQGTNTQKYFTSVKPDALNYGLKIYNENHSHSLKTDTKNDIKAMHGFLRKIKDYFGIIGRASDLFQIPKSLIMAVIARESGGEKKAVSAKGAMGLMQLMGGTARDMGVSDPFNPEQNIIGGAKYLRLLLDKYNGNLSMALAAYNAGPARVDSTGGIPAIKETREYVKNVIEFKEKMESELQDI